MSYTTIQRILISLSHLKEQSNTALYYFIFWNTMKWQRCIFKLLQPPVYIIIFEPSCTRVSFNSLYIIDTVFIRKHLLDFIMDLDVLNSLKYDALLKLAKEKLNITRRLSKVSSTSIT